MHTVCCSLREKQENSIYNFYTYTSGGICKVTVIVEENRIISFCTFNIVNHNNNTFDIK